MLRLVIAAALLILAGPALGQPKTISFAEATKILVDACGPDMEAHCRGVNIGGSRLRSCLSRSAVTATCRDAYIEAFGQIDKRIQARFAVRKACDPEARKFCGEVQGGDGAVLECISQVRRGVGWRCTNALIQAGMR